MPSHEQAEVKPAEKDQIRIDRLRSENVSDEQKSLVIEEVYKDYFIKIRNYIFSLIRFRHSIETAEEIAQETFIVFITNYDTYRGDGSSLFPWLLKIAHNKAVNVLRYKSQPMVYDNELPDIALGDPAEIIGTKLTFQEALSSVDSNSRQYLLELGCGLSHTEIANRHGISLNVLNKKLIKARKIIRGTGETALTQGISI